MFPMATEVALQIRRGPDELSLAVSIPAPRSRKQPYSEVEAVIFKHLTDGTGYLKVSILPGLLVWMSLAPSIEQCGTGRLRQADPRSPRHLGGGLAFSA